MAKFIDRTGQHYGRLTVLSLVTRKPRVRWLCVCGCGNETEVFGYSLKSGGTQSCGCLHAERLAAAIKKDFNDHVIFGDVVEVRLTQGHFVIDTVDLPLVREHRWFNSAGFYVGAVINGVVFTLHRFLMNPNEGEVVDHKNGDTMDYRRCNLRVATQTQNAANRTRLSSNNRSGYHGVHWSKKLNKWITQTKVDGKTQHLGCFDTPEDAARAYNKKVREVHGEFATKLNAAVEEEMD